MKICPGFIPGNETAMTIKHQSRFKEGEVLQIQKRLLDSARRLVREIVDGRAEFLNTVERAPAALADESSQRRRHLHGLMIGTEGISGPGKTEFRLKLRAIKREADSDLLFKTTEETIRQIRSRRQDIDMYSRKNGLSVELNPMLPDAYRRLPAGKQAFISSQPRQEALSDDKWF